MTTKSGKKRGRPSGFNQRMVDRICSELITGKSMREVCLLEGMPTKDTVFRWLAQFPDFQLQYARAKEAQADHLAEELLEIADDGSNDWMERRNEKGEVFEVVPDHEHINRSRLRVDTRKWLMSHLLPKKYGDKLVNGGTTVVVDNRQVNITSVSAEDAAKEYAKLVDG